MLPDNLEFKQIAETDRANARGHENPEFEGLQTLSYEQVKDVVSWVEAHVEPSKYVDWGYTSEKLAHCCGHDLKYKRTQITNLMMKTALDLCGLEPIHRGHEIRHYHIEYTGGRK